jgi:hypothetical protein
MMRAVTARRVALVVAAVLGVYLVVVAERGILLLRDGRPAFVLLGVGVVLLPIVGLVVLVSELRFGQAAERLGRQLDAEGGLPADERPAPGERAPSREAADAAFLRRKAEVEAAPRDWRAWYRLALAYGEAGDTARGRRALRHAIALHRGVSR